MNISNLSEAQISEIRSTFKECIDNFSVRTDINETRDLALSLIETLCGEQSEVYSRFADAGAFTGNEEREYSDNDVAILKGILNGLLDSIDVLVAG